MEDRQLYLLQLERPPQLEDPTDRRVPLVVFGVPGCHWRMLLLRAWMLQRMPIRLASVWYLALEQGAEVGPSGLAWDLEDLHSKGHHDKVLGEALFHSNRTERQVALVAAPSQQVGR